MRRFSSAPIVLISLIFFTSILPNSTINGEIMPQDYFTTSASIPRGTVDPEVYVDTNKPDMTWNGTTLFADLHIAERPRIIEVNMLGEIVWQYVVPENLKQYTNPGFDVELLPNNNVLFVLPRKGAYEINRNGTVVWSYLDGKVSHDADRLPNGNTLIVWGGDDAIDDAQVKEINPKGDIVWSWYAKDHFYKTPFKDVYNEGWTHTNSATRLPNGNTLISLRNFNLTVEVNPQGSVVWSFGTGVFTCQHSPKILPNDNLLVADTTWSPQDYPPRVIEVNHKTGEIIWQFRPDGPAHIRDADRLPNGNTLIVMADRIIEVTPDLKLVWRLMNSAPLGKVGQAIYKAERIGMVDPRFSILSPQDKTYSSNEIDVSIKYSDADLSAILYRVYDRDKSKWVTGDLAYVRNKWKNAITFDGKETGIGKITLGDGNYTLRVWANSTGWGDMGENLFQPKVVNVAEASVNFSVLAKPATGLAPPSDIIMYGIAGMVTVAVAIAVVVSLRRKKSRGGAAG